MTSDNPRGRSALIAAAITEAVGGPEGQGDVDTSVIAGAVDVDVVHVRMYLRSLAERRRAVVTPGKPGSGTTHVRLLDDPRVDLRRGTGGVRAARERRGASGRAVLAAERPEAMDDRVVILLAHLAHLLRDVSTPVADARAVELGTGLGPAPYTAAEAADEALSLKGRLSAATSDLEQLEAILRRR